MAEKRFGVETRELFFPDRERHHGNRFRGDLLVAELFVEGHIRVVIRHSHQPVHGEAVSGPESGEPLLYLGFPPVKIVSTGIGVANRFDGELICALIAPILFVGLIGIGFRLATDVTIAILDPRQRQGRA